MKQSTKYILVICASVLITVIITKSIDMSKQSNDSSIDDSSYDYNYSSDSYDSYGSYTSDNYDSYISHNTYELSNGTYTVGTDLDPGTYNLTATSGYGMITGDFQSGYLSMGIGVDDNYPDHLTYNNLVLITGDTFTIKSGVTIKFES